jgi:curli biogenesis system outer membrane secretion channel CsgG
MFGKMNLVLVLLLVVLVPAVGFGAAAAPEPEQKTKSPGPPTVAILDYEAAAPDTKDLGAQMADILTARLGVEDAFQLVERAKLGKILEEQKLKLVGLADQDKAVEVGKLLGAQLMVIGKTFMMDKQLMIVTKVVGVETGAVKGTIRTVEPSKPLAEAIMLLAEDIATLIRKDAAGLLPPDTKLADPIAEIRAAIGDRPLPVVAVIVPEEHHTHRTPAPVVDPAVETEIKRALIACGFKVVDTGMNALADWARSMLKGKKGPWPAALQDADAVIVGEAFSEFAIRTGDLVTCTGRAEVNLVDRHTGEILLADRQTERAVDLAEQTAGKTALQKAGHKLALAVCRRLAAYKKPNEGPAPEAKEKPKGGARAAPCVPSPVRCVILAAPREEAPAPPASEEKPVKRTVFAAPFDNETGQEQYDPAGAGLGDLVAVLLAQQQNVTVVERQRLLALAEEQARSLKGLTGDKYALAAGKLLKADTVLVGRLFLVQGKLTVHARAIDIASERVLAADELACRPEDLIEAALQIARRLAKQMALPLPEIDLKQIDASPIASLHFAKALSHYYAGNMDEAIMQFMRTMDLDPDYMEAHFWMGICYQRLQEPEHAVIEWEAYLKRDSTSERAEAVKKLLAEAKAQDAASPVQRLGPKEEPAPRSAAPAQGQASPALSAPAAMAPPAQEGAPAETPKTGAPQAEEDTLAKSKLQLAQMFESKGLLDAAVREYRKIVELYPRTEAAAAAAERLKVLEPKPR